MKKGNINAWMWLFVLIVYSVFMISLILNKRIQLFIHPKMIKYIIFTIIMFFILISRQLKQLRLNNGSSKLNLSCFIFLIPVALAVIINPSQLNAKTATNKGVNIPNASQQQEVPLETKAPEESFQSIQPTGGYNTQDGQDFLAVIDGISNDFTTMLSAKVELSGFIYLQEDFSEGQFVIGRYMMNCCAADAQLIGVLCKYSGDYSLEADKWIRITGVVERTMYKANNDEEEMEMAQITITNIEGITPPEEQYVYPY